jgi:hypothetical protein
MNQPDPDDLDLETARDLALQRAAEQFAQGNPGALDVIQTILRERGDDEAAIEAKLGELNDIAVGIVPVMAGRPTTLAERLDRGAIWRSGECLRRPLPPPQFGE